jgi:adenylate cyclase
MAATRESTGERVALNADVVGYSGLLADDFDSTTATMEEYRGLVDELIEERGGTLVQFVGDSFMALFDDATDAVQAAIAVTAAIEARNDGVPKGRVVRFRMGIHQGEVADVGGQYHGDALNIAARIQALARPGGVSVSARVYQALDEPALRFRTIGPQSLKNIPEQVEVYEFADLPSDGAITTERRSLSLEAPTLAVLPIHTEMVDDPTRAAAAVIRGDLIHRLARVPELALIDSGSEPGVDQIRASARYILESGIHQLGEQVRVYVTLFDVTTFNVVKSHKWTAKADELFDLSDRLADEVARMVEVELIVGEVAGLYAELDDPEAIEKIYLGWYHLRTDTPEGWARALDLFGEVARTHPDQPYGHVLSAFASWLGASSGWSSDPEQALLTARQQAEAGSAVGDQTGLAMAVIAAVLMSQGKLEESLAALDRLEIVRPTCDVTYGLEGSLRRYMGQWEKAVDLINVAMRLTGITKPWYPTVKACSLFTGGRLDQAASIAESVLEYQPNNLEALLVLAAAQRELKMDRRAQATAELIKERFPSVDVEAWLEASPYKDHGVVERWRDDLVAAGAIDGD